MFRTIGIHHSHHSEPSEKRKKIREWVSFSLLTLLSGNLSCSCTVDPLPANSFKKSHSKISESQTHRALIFDTFVSHNDNIISLSPKILNLTKAAFRPALKSVHFPNVRKCCSSHISEFFLSEEKSTEDSLRASGRCTLYTAPPLT